MSRTERIRVLLSSMCGSHFGWACTPLTLTAESISWAIGRIFYPAWTKNSSYYSCRPEPERIALLVSDCRSGLRAGVTHIFVSGNRRSRKFQPWKLLKSITALSNHS